MRCCYAEIRGDPSYRKHPIEVDSGDEFHGDGYERIVIAECQNSMITASPHISAAEYRPLIVAHRGLLFHAPEMTLASYRASLELRLGIEFDVQVTKDGHLVCIHDTTVDRTTHGLGCVTDQTFAAIRQLDAGSRFDPEFAGEQIPTVKEVLKLVAEYCQYNILVAVDPKNSNIVEAVVRLAEKQCVLHRLLFVGRIASQPEVRNQIKRASGKALTSAAVSSPEELPGALTASIADWVYFRQFMPSKDQIDAVHRANKRALIAGKPVRGYFPENWLQVTGMGIDAILTDYPLELRTTLRRNAQALIDNKSREPDPYLSGPPSPAQTQG